MGAVVALPTVDPRRIRSRTDLLAQLDLLRRRAARGSGRAIVSLDQLARRSGLPRSTIHSYVSGLRLPPPDALDALVLALGAGPAECSAWAEALERVSTLRLPGAGSWTPLVPRQLPAAPIGFTGRAVELAALAAATRPPESGTGPGRVVVVTGPGGVGKTALVLRWAHAISPEYPDGQLWVDLRGFSASSPLEPVDALEQLLRAVGVGTIDLPADIDTRAAMFRSAVAGRRLLVVLDNARDSAQVRALLPGTTSATTVITSRNTARSLAAREGAQRLWLGPLAEADARALLGEGLSLRARGADVLSRIAALCEGLPLALRIARERLAPMAAEDVARFIDRLEGDRESLLAALDLDDGAGDASVRGMLRWSYDALPADAAEAFRYIPLCLIPTFDVSCMAVLLDKDPDTTRRLLDQLVAASLLDVADADHYRIHDLVSAFASECLGRASADSQIDQARRRLWRHICSIGEAAISHTDPGRPIRLPWPDQLEPLQPVESLSPGEAVAWVEENIDLACAAVSDAAGRDPVEYSWLLAERTWRAMRWVADVGRFEEAFEVVFRAAAAQDALTPAIFVSRLLAITYARRGQLSAAEAAFDRCIDLAERSGQRHLRSADRANRAFVWALRGELDRAIDELRASMAGRPPLDRVAARNALIELECQRGNVREAQDCLDEQEELAAHPELGFGLRLEVDLAFARVDLATKRPKSAFDRACSIEIDAARHGNREVLVQALVFKTRALLALGDVSAAEAAANQSCDAARAGCAGEFRVAAEAALADVELRLETPHKALTRARQTLELARSISLRHAECELLVLTAKSCVALRNWEGAATAVEEAVAVASDCGYTPLAAQARLVESALHTARNSVV